MLFVALVIFFAGADVLGQPTDTCLVPGCLQWGYQELPGAAWQLVPAQGIDPTGACTTCFTARYDGDEGLVVTLARTCDGKSHLFGASGLRAVAGEEICFALESPPADPDEPHLLTELTNTVPTCIEAPVAAAVIFQAGSSEVLIDGTPVDETEWTPFADGRYFVTRPALALPEAGGCAGPSVVWSDGVAEDAEALRLFVGFAGGLIVYSSCQRYNHRIEPGVAHRCVVATRGLLFSDGFESGDTSAWSEAALEDG